MDGSRIILAAHRGDKKKYPENTMPAFESALRFGADMIETDVHMTKDGHLVLIHDRNLLRTTGVNGFTNQTTLADIRKLDAGSWFSSDFINTPIPTVEEFILLIKNSNMLAYTFEADRTFAFLAATNELKRIVALGNVKVVSEGRSGACARAEYRKRHSRITLYGDGPQSPASLVDATRRRSALEGTRIVFWLDSEQVEISDSRLSIDTKGLKLPKGPEGK